MYCPTCQSANEKNALFCKSCGTKLYHSQQETISPNNETISRNGVSDKLLIIYCIAIFIGPIAIFAINRLINKWYDGPAYYFFYFLFLLPFIASILPALAIKNKKLKAIAVILASLAIISGVYVYKFVLYI